MSSCSPARTPSVPLIKQGPTLALSTLAFLLLFKGLAWSISLGSFRGGPTFPALFIGAVGGLLAAHLPGFSETPAVAVLMAATVVSILRLPLSANRHHPAADLQSRTRHLPTDHRRRCGRLPQHPDAVLSPRSCPGCHAGRWHAARRAALAYHRNRKPRRQSDMTTGHHARGHCSLRERYNTAPRGAAVASLNFTTSSAGTLAVMQVLCVTPYDPEASPILNTAQTALPVQRSHIREHRVWQQPARYRSRPGQQPRNCFVKFAGRGSFASAALSARILGEPDIRGYDHGTGCTQACFRPGLPGGEVEEP